MERKISEMRRATEVQEVEYSMLSSEINNPQLETALDSMKTALNKMSFEAERAHRIHKSKISALTN